MKTILVMLALLGAGAATAAQPSDTSTMHDCDCVTNATCEETMEITEHLIEACARAAHETNRAYCLALGDTSHAPWDIAPEWQRESCRNGVRGALDGNTPKQSHESWTREKLAAGWAWGPAKDPEGKRHPCLVPYDDLPPEQRAKDAIFVGVVRLVAGALSS